MQDETWSSRERLPGHLLVQVGVFVMLLLMAMIPAMGMAQETALVQGLDGGEYEAYKPSVIENVQHALQEKGLYEGDVHGQLDEATMKAIQSFQKQHGIQASGVPSPYTRQALFGKDTEHHAERE